eukprot:CAMPEP_0196579722 /NCGR_PEP_ID=MMETSP1081-20130531/24475_1 /TAXON_ID=36882 /ORGANISM="Pyramimonas amylifera, Strain CCMP720" /LENGTH=169 /DNA_ID=CAMNT_0041899385 /DNA_START=168 /DNA_END=677 /DNA_ORIENTATION=+
MYVKPSYHARHSAVKAISSLNEVANISSIGGFEINETSIAGIAALSVIPLSRFYLLFKYQAAKAKCEEQGIPSDLGPYEDKNGFENLNPILSVFNTSGTPMMTKNAILRYRLMAYQCNTLCEENNIDTNDIPPVGVYITAQRTGQQAKKLKARLAENGIEYKGTYDSVA